MYVEQLRLTQFLRDNTSTSIYHYTDIPVVITLAPSSDVTYDDVPLPQALRMLEELGADVVGLNCFRGPDTMLPLMREIRKECKVRMNASKIRNHILKLTNF